MQGSVHKNWDKTSFSCVILFVSRLQKGESNVFAYSSNIGQHFNVTYF